MDELEFTKALRSIIQGEQELYRRYLALVDATDDLEMKEILGHHAFEEFTHLNALIDRYKEMVDDLRKRGML